MRILVIEDEKKTAAFWPGLREAGFVVDLARDGETVWSAPARPGLIFSYRRCHVAK
jgi:DNA-binding response OmpR family regulator